MKSSSTPSAAPWEELEPDEPMSREALDTPEMQAKIAKAQATARRGRTAPGKTADDLLELAREQRGVDPRTER
jgi:hypothetical protein